MRIPRLCLIPGLLHGGLLIAGLATAVPVFALPLSNEAATKRADMLVARVARGDINAAFSDAESWRRPEDTDFNTRLEQMKQAVATQATALGVPRSAQLHEESHFVEACVERDYWVRYAGGTQEWKLKYHRGSRGWYLYDLVVPGA